MENQNPYQYGYNNPNVQQPNQNGSKAMSIVALVLGILAFLGCYCYCSALPFGIISIILAIIVIVKKKNGKGMAIASLILSIISVISSIGIIAAFTPMAEDMTTMVEDLPQIIEDYQEDGSLPDYLEEYREQYPEIFDAFMQGMIEEYEKNPELYQMQ